jgi:ABC-2 type transport system permease protein
MLVIPVLVFTCYMPWTLGQDWLETPWSLVAAFFIPLLLVGTTIPESFAGERERHTLGTLLASRLPDRAILFGKIAVAVAYGWGVTLLALFVGMVIVNIAHWEGAVTLYAPTVALANVAVSLLLACLMASLGVLISLRSATVQGATQFLMVLLMIPAFVLQIGAAIVLETDPDWLTGLKDALSGISGLHAALIGIAVLIVIDLGLLRLAMGRFQRSRLILD